MQYLASKASDDNVYTKEHIHNNDIIDDNDLTTMADKSNS